MISKSEFGGFKVHTREFNHMKKRIFATIVSLAAFVLFYQAGSTAIIGQETAAAKTARLLNDAGIVHNKVGENIWSVPYLRKDKREFQVFVTTAPDTLVMFSVLVRKKDLKLTPELMQKLLRLNTEMDSVKLGIDKDGDLIARIDLGIRTLDAADLKSNLDQTAGAVSETLAVLRPLLPALK